VSKSIVVEERRKSASSRALFIPMRRKLGTALSWLVVALGSFVGIFLLSKFGMAWPALRDNNYPGWFLRSLALAGTGLFALVFLIGSLVAPRNPVRAGAIFLVFLPITAFCLAYPESGLFVRNSGGGGWFETPPPWTAIDLTTLFFAPFVVSLLTWRNKKRAASVFACASAIATLVFLRSRWAPVFVPLLAAFSTPFLLFGLFWLATDKLGWPPLLQPRRRAMSKRIAAFVVTCFVVLCVDVALTLGLSALGSSLFSGDCKGKEPMTHAASPTHAVFTARVIIVGRSREARTRATGLGSLEVQDSRLGDWAIGVVEKRFWGMPSRWPHLVLLTDFIYWQGETYFIDGWRKSGLFSQIVPIVGARISCSRSRPIGEAINDLRALEQPLPLGGTRIIGYVRKPEVFRSGLARPIPPPLLAGARIDIVGAAGTKTITTDESGVYQIDGLPPGDYSLQLAVPENQVVDSFFDGEGSPVEVHLDPGEVREHNFLLYWNGRIEGHVKDDTGKPAHVWVMLLNTDGSSLAGNVNFFLQTKPDGSYQVKKVPPGRYIVMVNPDGPYDEWPYDIKYYPSALYAQDAQVLELGDGQKINGIDFIVPRLAERTVRVHVASPNGTSATNTHVCLAYEHTKDYELLAGTSCTWNTDRIGEAVIHLYGDSRVRLFAEKYVNEANSLVRYHSAPFESQAGKMPENIDLVLASSER
jgi:hypothetical protein